MHRSIKEAEDLFSERELEIIETLIGGNTNKAIADQLHISQRSVEYQLQRIYKKLGVCSRKQVADKVNEMGIFLPASFEQ
ncbi:LuxR C-terminal-related transcriptional regulator [Terrilactibacillus sp. S3-3]|nr:LuxR C-terminal-related transcriptional regulator [Terrilactibacillus sp. S3-3]